MHIYFSGIGGTGIGPLSLIAHQAGYDVSGSDKQHSIYIDYLKKHGVDDVHIGQSYAQIAEVHAQRPIDWFVYSSAVVKEQGDLPEELRFCQEHGIRATRRDELLNEIISQQGLKLVAIAGTHGKTTTTAMAVWLFQRLGIPESHSVAAKMGFAEMGSFTPGSEYFIYEADEYDRNFLAFHPHISIITGLDWDHADIYPTRDIYNQAFVEFLNQSQQAIMWDDDEARLGTGLTVQRRILSKQGQAGLEQLTLAGKVNREDALEVAAAVETLTGKPLGELITHLNTFPGVGRRFERIAPNIYSDYAHTPPKIRGALQMAHELSGDNVVVVYEGLHNTRQHFIKDELANLFAGVKHLYIVPSYLAREDTSLALLSPEDLKKLMQSDIQAYTDPASLDDALAGKIRKHASSGDLVLCISAGGGNSLDEWVRRQFLPAGTPEAPEA
ncbi:MAG TPA: Mur ligase domain-containing protein [Candidatus Saccharimonadales bacterium]|nr:Mur ligase domain-containing protein [Candidatus Saccharimonadales bacterium]